MGAYYEDFRGRWLVSRLIRYAAFHTTAKRVPIQCLVHNFWKVGCDEPIGSPEFCERARKADLRYPVILVREHHGAHTVLDGMHRLWKAKEIKGATSLWARVLNVAELRTIQQDSGHEEK